MVYLNIHHVLLYTKLERVPNMKPLTNVIYVQISLPSLYITSYRFCTRL